MVKRLKGDEKYFISYQGSKGFFCGFQDTLAFDFKKFLATLIESPHLITIFTVLRLVSLLSTLRVTITMTKLKIIKRETVNSTSHLIL